MRYLELHGVAIGEAFHLGLAIPCRRCRALQFAARHVPEPQHGLLPRVKTHAVSAFIDPNGSNEYLEQRRSRVASSTVRAVAWNSNTLYT